MAHRRRRAAGTFRQDLPCCLNSLSCMVICTWHAITAPSALRFCTTIFLELRETSEFLATRARIQTTLGAERCVCVLCPTVAVGVLISRIEHIDAKLLW